MLQLQDLNVCSIRAAVETVALIGAYVLLAIKVLPIIIFEYIRMNFLSQQSINVLQIALFHLDLRLSTFKLFILDECFNLAVVLAYELPDCFDLSLQDREVHVVLFLVILLINVFEFLLSTWLLSRVCHQCRAKLSIFVAYTIFGSVFQLQEVLQRYLAVSDDVFDVMF